MSYLRHYTGILWVARAPRNPQGLRLPSVLDVPYAKLHLRIASDNVSSSICTMKGIMKLIAVIGSAGFLGVMLSIGTGLVPFFYLAGPSAFEAWFATYFRYFLIGVLGTSVPAFVGSMALMRRSAKGSYERRLWRNTMLGLVFVYAVTTAVHLPLNLAFWSFGLSDEAIVTNLGWWSAAHVLRVAGSGFASYSAFRAVSRTKRHQA